MSVSAPQGTAFYLNLRGMAGDASTDTPDFAADFESIDDQATGVITRNEFEQAFGSLPWPDWLKAPGPDAIFAQLDPAGTGRVLYDDFVSGMTALAAAEAPAATDTPVTDPSSTQAASSSGLSGLSSLFASLSSASTSDQTSQATAAASSDTPEANDTALTQTFETAYAGIDTNGVGYITAPQLAQAFGSLTLPTSIAALGSAGVLAKLDANFTGQISHSAFVTGLTALASTASAAAASSSTDDSSDEDAELAALKQFYDNVFTSIAPDDGSDTITDTDLERGFDQLQLPASLGALTPSALFGKLDPYSLGTLSRSNFIRDMTDLVAAAKNQEAQASTMAAAAGAQPNSRDFAAMFAIVDVPGSGSVTLRQLEQAFDALPLDSTIAGLGADVIFSMLDPNATGRVSAATFVSGLNTLANAEDYFRTAADSIDRDGDGVITSEEFQQAFDSLQLPATARDLGAATVYSLIDPYYTRQVLIAEFVDGMTTLIAQSGSPAGATAATTNATNGDLILNTFYQSASTS